MEKRFEGKITVVTGAGSGIGRGTALRFAEEGASLVLADVNEAGLRETAEQAAGFGAAVLVAPADVSRPDRLRELAGAAVDRFDCVDILVNAAGIVQSRSFLEVTEEDWDRIIDINQKGTAFACQIFGNMMSDRVPEEVKRAGKAGRSYGKIVNFSSIAGRRGRSFQLHYAASKAAIISITQSAALAFAPYGINVNAVSPSVVLTPMWEASVTQKAQTQGIGKQQAEEEMLSRIPLHRAGEVSEIAAAVAFLCSREADYITGQTLNVDGGYEMN